MTIDSWSRNNYSVGNCPSNNCLVWRYSDWLNPELGDLFDDVDHQNPEQEVADTGHWDLELWGIFAGTVDQDPNLGVVCADNTWNMLKLTNWSVIMPTWRQLCWLLLEALNVVRVGTGDRAKLASVSMCVCVSGMGVEGELTGSLWWGWESYEVGYHEASVFLWRGQ